MSVLDKFSKQQSHAFNFDQIWKKQGVRFESFYQIYIALIFRFMRMKSQLIDQHKLKNLFEVRIDKNKISRLPIFSNKKINLFSARHNQIFDITQFVSIAKKSNSYDFTGNPLEYAHYN